MTESGSTWTRIQSRSAALSEYLLPLLAVWGLPWLLVLLIDVPGRETAALAAQDAAPRRVAIGLRTDDGRQSGTLDLVWSPAESMVIASQQGVITDVLVETNVLLEDGSPIVAINGVSVAAQTRGMPLFRDLRIGDSGRDVQWLNQYLSSIPGVASDDLGRTSVFGAETEAAVVRYATTIGVQEPSPVFDDAWMIFVGQNRVVASLSVESGALVQPGSEIASYEQQLSAATLSLDGPPGRQGLLRAGRRIVLESPSQGAPVILTGLKFNSQDLEVLSENLTERSLSIPSVAVRLEIAVEFATVPARSVVPSDDLAKHCIFITQDSSEAIQMVDISGNFAESPDPQTLFVPAHLAGSNVIENPWSDSIRLRCE